ncbi:putative phytosulfokines 6 isoform X2 [Alnus glutinosa]|uniref:putative phytosulfokines 6 isoform X2 n=1 Tax=Alnus glutinosa TaxID=3517 RepID=UPI002D773B86|nr:putative phytosulfokines 6 isoform X2 [Alnus glutinosa]
MKKQSFYSNIALLLFLFLLISCSEISARSIPTKKGQEELKLEESMNLMGLEDCNKGDEECLQRRIISEAHLDYIYTQHHKP